MSLDNLLDIQSEMSRSIANAMQATLSPQEEALLDRRMTDNLEALDAYRKARRFSEKFDAVDLAKADLEIQHALDLDPGFVAAWALKAYIHMSTYWGVFPDEAQRVAAREAIDRGRAIEPDSPDLDLAEGYYYYWGFLDYEAALKVLEPVLKVYPNDVELLKVLAYVNRRYGQFDVSYAYMEKAYALAPRDLRLIYALGETKNAMREWDAAQGFLDQIQKLDPTHPRTLQLQGLILAGRDNDYQGAVRNFKMADEDSVRLGENIWMMLILDHDYEAALAAASFGANRESSVGNIPPEMAKGITHLLAGNRDEAVPLLEQARVLLEQWHAKEPENWYDHQSLCRTLGALKDQQAALTECNAVIANMPNDKYDLSYEQEIIASAFAMAGLEDQALDLLEQVAESRIGIPVSMISANPMYESLHNTRRWQALMQKHGIQL